MICVVDSLPFLELILQDSVAPLTTFDVLTVPAVTVLPELYIYLEVISEVLLLLLAERRQFLQLDHCSPVLSTSLPRQVDKRSIEDITDQQILAKRLIFLDIDGHIPSKAVLLVEPDRMLLILLDLRAGLNLMRVVDGLASGVVDYLYVWVFYLELASECYLFYGEDLWVGFWVCKVGMEVFDVFYLAGLGHSVAVLLEPSPRVKAQHFPTAVEDAHEEKEAADDGASPSLAMIAVKDGDPLLIPIQKLRDLIADSKQHVEGRRLVVLPIIINHILQHMLINTSSTHIDSDILVMMLLGK